MSVFVRMCLRMCDSKIKRTWTINDNTLITSDYDLQAGLRQFLTFYNCCTTSKNAFYTRVQWLQRWSHDLSNYRTFFVKAFSTNISLSCLLVLSLFVHRWFDFCFIQLTQFQTIIMWLLWRRGIVRQNDFTDRMKKQPHRWTSIKLLFPFHWFADSSFVCSHDIIERRHKTHSFVSLCSTLKASDWNIHTDYSCHDGHHIVLLIHAVLFIPRLLQQQAKSSPDNLIVVLSVRTQARTPRVMQSLTST